MKCPDCSAGRPHFREECLTPKVLDQFPELEIATIEDQYGEPDPWSNPKHAVNTLRRRSIG